VCAGNDNLYVLTSSKRQRLRVDLADFENNTRYAIYDYFAVGPASAKYNLASLGQYSGDAGQSVTYIQYIPYVGLLKLL